MNVAELIRFLQTQPQDLLVAYSLYGAKCLLGVEQFGSFEACAPRPDGWIQDKRPDMPAKTYLLFPGN